jgi:putative transposase
MNEVSLLQSLGQVSSSQTGQAYRDFLRGQAREMICEVMAAEVTELCGPKHHPSSRDHYRAGTYQGRVSLESSEPTSPIPPADPGSNGMSGRCR